MDVDQQTFIPGRSKLAAGETLAPDPSTYDMLHTLTTTWPCLSFDIVRDNLGDNRKAYPATVYAVAGTQAEAGREKENELMVMKLGGLSRMDRERDEDDSDDESEASDKEKAKPATAAAAAPVSSPSPAATIPWSLPCEENQLTGRSRRTRSQTIQMRTHPKTSRARRMQSNQLLLLQR